MNEFWTDRKIESLLDYWAKGHSTTEIGVFLGCTRNAVIGKLHRLKAPEPVEKLPILRNRVYTQQAPEESRAKARIREKRYQLRKRSEARAVFRSRGASPYSASYRKHLPPLPEMTKGELRAMLSQALVNTAAMS